ncbi:FAD/FMN-containing dehydrogenase [Pseudomonas helleri]|uniref:FAD/FMN-containing dehydrogenase n=1 Tax=Pseudomonas helleri TaxID=1608996 RepID=UPI003F979D47
MRIALLLLLSVLSMQSFAATVGEHLTPWTLQDQHDQPYTLDANTHVLLVARNMDGSKLVKAALENQPKGYLEARHVTFLADVHAMPSLIGKFIAIPKMRDYSYRVVLDRDGNIAAQYPGADDQVLWLQLDNGTLVSQQTFASADALRAALEKLPTE